MNQIEKNSSTLNNEEHLLNTLGDYIVKILDAHGFSDSICQVTALHFRNALKNLIPMYSMIKSSYERMGLPQEIADKKAAKELFISVFNPDFSESIISAFNESAEKPPEPPSSMYR